MSQNGYTRQSSAGIVTGATILASGLNAEYNALVSAFDNTSGHRHDASVTGGGASLVPASLTSITSTTGGLIGADGANGFTARTITGTSGKITVTNGSGASGNPTITIDSTYIGQNTITTLGTITTGVWTGTTIALANGGTGATTAATARTNLGLAIGTNVEAWSTVLDSITSNTGVLPQYGGTGINNSNLFTITLGGAVSTAGALTTAGAFITSGANSLTLTTTGTTNVTLPTSGTLVNTAVATLSSLTSVGTIGTGTWQGTVIGSTYGGTGVNNGSAILTMGGSHTLSGAFASTFTFTGITSVTFPTSGTLVNTAVATLSSLTSVGTIGTGTWQGTKIGTLYGGTNLDSSASTGIAQVSSGTWSVATSLPNGTTATTQTAADNSTKVATTAYADAVTVTAAKLGGMSKITNTLSGDVTMTSGSTFYDGPSIAQGTSGTWYVTGTITLANSSNCNYTVKLWDGTTVFASTVHGQTTSAGSGNNIHITLSAIVTTPAANIKMSASCSTTGGTIVFNASGSSKDSQIQAIRIG